MSTLARPPPTSPPSLLSSTWPGQPMLVGIDTVRSPPPVCSDPLSICTSLQGCYLASRTMDLLPYGYTSTGLLRLICAYSVKRSTASYSLTAVELNQENRPPMRSFPSGSTEKCRDLKFPSILAEPCTPQVTIPASSTRSGRWYLAFSPFPSSETRDYFFHLRAHGKPGKPHLLEWLRIQGTHPMSHPPCCLLPQLEASFPADLKSDSVMAELTVACARLESRSAIGRGT